MSVSSHSYNMLLPLTFRQHQRVTAGLIDERSERAFTSGQCFAMAYSLMESLSDEERKLHSVHFVIHTVQPGATYKDVDVKDYFVHCYVVNGKGIKIDITGTQPAADYVKWWTDRYTNEHHSIRVESAEWSELQGYQSNRVGILIEGVPKQRFDAARKFTDAVWDRAAGS